MGLFRRKPRGPTPAPEVTAPSADLDRLTSKFEAEAGRLAAEMLADLDAQFPQPDPLPVEPESASTRSAASASPSGPSWMASEEWADRLAAYTRQGRSAEDIQQVVDHLEHRGPPRTREEAVARAKSVGLVFREEYMSPEDEARALALGDDGLPDAHLERVRNRLLVVTPAGWVNPRSRSAYKAGLHSFMVRGTSYAPSPPRSRDFKPGAPIRLVREPDNKHDSNAIAVFTEPGGKHVGYVPKAHAKRLARLLDDGADLVAVSVRDLGPDGDEVTPHLLVCERRLMEHLNRAK